MFWTTTLEWIWSFFKGENKNSMNFIVSGVSNESLGSGTQLMRKAVFDMKNPRVTWGEMDGNEVFTIVAFLGWYLFVRSYVSDTLIWRNWLDNLHAPMMMIWQHLGTSSLEHLFCEEKITTISSAKANTDFTCCIYCWIYLDILIAGQFRYINSTCFSPFHWFLKQGARGESFALSTSRFPVSNVEHVCWLVNKNHVVQQIHKDPIENFTL